MKEIEKYKLGNNESKILSEQLITVNGSRMDLAASSCIGLVHPDKKNFPNQDRAIIVCDPRSDAYFFGVFDGFDKYGHVFAELMANMFVENISLEENIDDKVKELLTQSWEEIQKFDQGFIWSGTAFCLCFVNADGYLHEWHSGDCQLIIFDNRYKFKLATPVDREHDSRNNLTRAFANAYHAGMERMTNVFIKKPVDLVSEFKYKLSYGDKVIVCSDGVTDNLRNVEELGYIARDGDSEETLNNISAEIFKRVQKYFDEDYRKKKLNRSMSENDFYNPFLDFKPDNLSCVVLNYRHDYQNAPGRDR